MADIRKIDFSGRKKMFITGMILLSVILLLVSLIIIEEPQEKIRDAKTEAASGDHAGQASMVWEQRFPHDAPLPRTTHASAYLGNGEMLVFGGEVRSSPKATSFWCGNDTWIYNISSNQWRNINTPVSPRALVHTPMAYDVDDNAVLLFGGWCNEKDKNYLLKDTWIFNVTGGEWVKKSPKVSPGAQSDMGLVYTGNSNFLMRTADGETWIYNLHNNNWSLINRGLPLRGSAAMAYDPDKDIVLSFGGENSHTDEYYNDTWEYYVPDNKWIKVNTSPSPEERARAGIAYDTRNRVFVLFGGVTSQYGKRFNDTWTYSTATRTWTKINTSNTPTLRGGYYGMAFDPVLDLFVLFGGRHDPRTFLNETWILKYAG